MIRQYRLQNKLTQEELAEEIGISWRQLQRLEHNEEKTRISTFKKIVKVLKIPDDEVLRFIKDKNKQLTYNEKGNIKYGNYGRN